MGNFTNLKTFVEPETTLFQQEVDVILATVNHVLSSLAQRPTQGTFILDGQEFGKEAYNIIFLNLEQGAWQNILGTSDKIAAKAIDEILVWPEEQYFFCRPEAKCFGMLPSGIYYKDRQRTLVLNTTYGRFLASYFAGTGCGIHLIDHQDEGSTILLAVAKAIALMGKEDKILQRSFQRIQSENSHIEDGVTELVQKMFDHCTLPALKAWKAWYEPANNAGELTLFFE